MTLDSEYKQIWASQIKVPNELKGKIVDKIGFFNRKNYDENIFAITFTDKTFIAIGCHYNDREGCEDEPQIKDFVVIHPEQYSGGLGRYVYIDENKKPILYDSFVKVLSELGIWDVTAEDLKKAQNEIDKRKEEWEYRDYLRLKEKFENGNEATK